MTRLVCLEPLRDAIQQVEQAEVNCRAASYALAHVREELDRAVEKAYGQRSFARLGNLLDREEAALALYEQAKAQLSSARERWRNMGTALALEREGMLAGPMSHKQMN